MALGCIPLKKNLPVRNMPSVLLTGRQSLRCLTSCKPWSWISARTGEKKLSQLWTGRTDSWFWKQKLWFWPWAAESVQEGLWIFRDTVRQGFIPQAQHRGWWIWKDICPAEKWWFWDLVILGSLWPEEWPWKGQKWKLWQNLCLIPAVFREILYSVWKIFTFHWN